MSGDETSRQRREALRDRARQQRETAAQRRRRRRLLVQAGIAAAVIAVVAIAAVVIVSTTRGTATASTAPAHMVDGGITIGRGERAVAHQQDGTPGRPLVRAYEDFICSSCGAFEQANATYLAGLVAKGSITLELNPVSILDRLSQGTDYSTRAASAAACVADHDPDRFFAFHRLLYANEPAEGSAGLTDAQLAGYATQAGAAPAAAITSCITSHRYAKWVTAQTDAIARKGLPRSGGASFTGTPSIVIDDRLFTGNFASSSAVAAAIEAARP